ncbi:uncharacterized protein N7515_008203 [Penicillium bovifimosum]|uniref:DUF6606 domain-containing protein n=1 Tax=Penicillium bovifimosum TaxID=126998 RepID=A0A9W9GMT4_9EURO|nr:uncharacterized protein N7515_008203 [Penicillium bovifimosum]KAJ5124378.1 hypothetical protein N7515_008203 [Penicillium bovifimosum]
MSHYPAMDLDEELFSFLPQEAEEHLDRLEIRMVAVIQAVLQEFIRNLTPESQLQWEFAYNLVDSWIQMHMDQGISQQGLETELSNLKSGGALACHIRAQNCGWVAYYDREKDSLLIDAFEVSCEDAPVLSSSGGLIRHFPGVSVAISGHKLNDPLFCSYLASSVSQLASEEVSDMAPKTTKANTKVDEHRETTHPGLITEGLMTELLALGEHNQYPDKILNQLLLRFTAMEALSRSPAWLVLRVALQVVLRRCFAENEDRMQYKNFILFLMARLSAGANIYRDPTNAVDCWAIIRQRLGRRIFKLGHDVFPFVAEEVTFTSNHLLDKLKCIQTQIGASDGADIPFVPPSASPEDLHMSLVNSRPYLQAKMRLSPEKVRRTRFDPTDKINLSWSDGFPVLKHGSVAALGEFEEWVEEHLQSWFEAQPTSKYEQACLKIGDAIEQYFTLAQLKYQADPRATSLMVLVLVELWAVLDKIAVQICPLLEAFSPEVPQRFLEPLLLPKMSEMRRARDIEHHLSTRHEEKVENYPSIFSDPEPNCFGAQYFDRSDYHQKLEVSIEKHATQLRERKWLEWKDLHAEYKELQDQAAQLEHRHHYGYNRRRRLVSLTTGYEECSIIGKANQLSIEVYEWPLPPEDIARKCAVFELDIPIWFASWRNVTWTLVDELPQRPMSPAGNVIFKWLNYTGVNEFKVRRHSKLELASNRKPWGHTREHRSLPVTFEVVCPENALRLRLLDSNQSAWVSSQTEVPTVKTMCTIQLPPGPYSKLQYTVNSPSHHQNEVLASQADCDRLLDLDEFIAYGCLRSGENVQWHNILRELASSALLSPSSSKQPGSLEHHPPTRTPFEVTHRAFEDIGFGDRLLQTLQGLLEAIERNWNEYWTFELVVTLAVRTLALSNQSPSPESVINFLRQCRQVAMEWCDSLSEALSTDQGEDVGKKQQIILRVASICQTTYDVERTQMSQVISSSQDLFCFVRSSLLLFENAPSETCKLPGSVKTMVENWQKIAFRIRESVKNLIMTHPSGLNEAIHRGISCLEISEPWSICEGSNTSVATRTGSTFTGFSQHVHFNYLTGEILVDGSPPGKLPRSYLSDPLYQRLFGSVHFGMAAGEFFIKTRKGSQILQLIPHAVFQEDFPRPFVTEYYHWLNLQTGAVVFRPLNQPWKSCESNWRLSFDPQMPDQMLMQAGSKTLVDIRSRPFALLGGILNVLDKTEEIILVQTSTGILEAELNRLRLKFFVNSDGRVVSKEFGAFVDSTQRIGCLYGLVDKLVLVDSSNARCVIVPYGEPIVARKGYHVSLKVNRPEGGRVKYMVYSMDTHLQILRCSDSLAAIYQAYLHALTSFPIPDHFTHRSGTAEAIRILRQGCLRSSFPLNNDCIRILKSIAALTPVRGFHPPKLCVMQIVAWSGVLGQLAQDDDFQPLSLEILEFADQFASFHGTKPRAQHVAYAGSTNLLNRARCRNEQLRCSEVRGPPSLYTKKTYLSRDQDVRSPRSNRVYELTALVRDWPSAVDHSSNIVETMRKFTNVSTHSPNLSDSSCSQLMGLSTERDWVALYNFCRSKSRSRDTYSLISVLAKVGFGGIIDQSVLLQLLSIAFSASCREIPWPCSQVTSFDLTRGEDFNIREIETAIWECYTPFTPSTNGTMPNQHKEWANRRLHVASGLPELPDFHPKAQFHWL